MTCKDCPNRHVGCHATCPDYAAFKLEQEKIKELKQQERAADGVGAVRKQRCSRIILQRKKNGLK